MSFCLPAKIIQKYTRNVFLKMYSVPKSGHWSLLRLSFVKPDRKEPPLSHPAVSAAVRPLSRQFSPVLLRPSHGNPSRAARHMDVFPAAIDPSSHNDQRIFLFHRDAAICTATYRLYTCNWYHVSRRLHRPISAVAPKWQITQSILTCDTHTLFHRDPLRILTT